MIYATLVMTVLIFVSAEVLPKTAAFNAPDRMALAVAQPVERMVRWFSPMLEVGRMAGAAACCAACRHAGRQDPVDPVAARGTARRGRSDASRRRRGKTRPRHDGRLARSARADGVRRHGPPHQDGHARCRRAATRVGRRRAGRRRNAAAVVARLARQHHRRAARQGVCARAARGRRRCDARSTSWRWRRRHGSCRTPRRSPSSSRRSATARRRSRWWSTNMANWKVW